MGLGILTHWGRATHICDDNLTIIGPDNGLLPGRCQAIIWTNAGPIGPWGTNFNEILIGIHTFSFKKIHLQISSAKWRLFWLIVEASLAGLSWYAKPRYDTYCNTIHAIWYKGYDTFPSLGLLYLLMSEIARMQCRYDYLKSIEQWVSFGICWEW